MRDLRDLMHREVAGIRMPDTKLAIEATELVYQASSRSLFNHVVRTYLFGELFGRAAEVHYDSEALYLASIMHDLGLTKAFQGCERFEVDGADAARKFLEGRGLSEQTIWLIWDAIALHTSVGIAHRKQPEVALVHLATGTDVIGLRLDEISKDHLHQVLEAFPRLQFKAVFLNELKRVVQIKPQTAAFNFMADVARCCVAGYVAPDATDLFASAPFAE
jgi:hypothetical protein